MEFVEFYPVNKIFTAEMTFIVVLRKFRKTPSICRKLTFRRVFFLYHRSKRMQNVQYMLIIFGTDDTTFYKKRHGLLLEKAVSLE